MTAILRINHEQLWSKQMGIYDEVLLRTLRNLPQDAPEDLRELIVKGSWSLSQNWGYLSLEELSAGNLQTLLGAMLPAYNEAELELPEKRNKVNFSSFMRCFQELIELIQTDSRLTQKVEET